MTGRDLTATLLRLKNRYYHWRIRLNLRQIRRKQASQIEETR